MKNHFKKIVYKLTATLMLLAIFQTAVLAEDGKAGGANSSLSAVQVIGGVALIIVVVLIPAFKGSRKITAK
jgi:hypothetical protein